MKETVTKTLGDGTEIEVPNPDLSTGTEGTNGVSNWFRSNLRGNPKKIRFKPTNVFPKKKKRIKQRKNKRIK